MGCAEQWKDRVVGEARGSDLQSLAREKFCYCCVYRYCNSYTDKKAITSLTIQDVLKMKVTKGEMRNICELMEAIRDNDLLNYFIDSRAEGKDDI